MPAISAALLKAGFISDEQARRFRDLAGVPVQFVAAGARAGKGSEVLLPSPADDDVAVIIEGLPVLSLPALVESQLACGAGDARRMHRDFAEVVELIAVQRLDGTFARHSTRPSGRPCGGSCGESADQPRRQGWHPGSRSMTAS